MDRQFLVNINGHNSEIKTYEYGVPQGAVLSSTLYNIFTFDIPKHIHTELALFTDDTAVYSSSPFANTITIQMQAHADSIHNYFNKWKIKLNEQKTQAILITKRRKLELPGDNIIISNTTVNWESIV